LAAAASATALAGPRLELFPRDLSPIRALRLSQAGAGLPQNGLSADQVRERVTARLPGLAPLPDGPALVDLLHDAGFVVRAEGQKIVPQTAALTAVVDRSLTGTEFRTSGGLAEAAGPMVSAVGGVTDRLLNARSAGGFRVVTARYDRLARTREHLQDLFGVPATDATRAFLDGIRRIADDWKMTDLSVVFEADAAPAGSPDAVPLRRMVEQTLDALRESWMGPDAHSVLLLDDLTPLGRYDPQLRLVNQLAARARRGGNDGHPRTVVLLCAAAEDRRSPRIAGRPVTVLSREEWLIADPRWATAPTAGQTSADRRTTEGAA
jgi:hypothetical protein